MLRGCVICWITALCLAAGSRANAQDFGTALVPARESTLTDGLEHYLQPVGDASRKDTRGLLSLATQADAMSSYRFGSQAVRTASAPASLTLQFNGLTEAPSIQLRYGFEYSLGTTVCTASGGGTLTCQTPVTFTPSSPGLRQDALISSDGAGNVLTTVLLSGIGLGPQWSVTPGLVMSVANSLYPTTDVAVDPEGNVYFADISGIVSKMNAAGQVTKIAGGGSGGDGGPAVNASLDVIWAIALDGSGNLYLAEWNRSVVRKVDATTGLISTVAGNGQQGYTGDGGPAIQASFFGPHGLAIDRDGNMFIADLVNCVVRRVDAATGVVRTLVGNGHCVSSGDGGLANTAEIEYPTAIAIDAIGNLFIADGTQTQEEMYVRRVDAQTNVITSITIPGMSDPAAILGYDTIDGLAVDAAGDLYVSVSGENLIYRVDASGGTQRIAGVAGGNDQSYAGDGGPATSAYFGAPAGLAVDGQGNLYVADLANDAVREITAAPSPLSFLASASNSAAPQTATVSNIGNQPLPIFGHTTRVEPGRAFANATADFPQTDNCGPSLNSGANCGVIVGFTPAGSVPAARSAGLEIDLHEKVMRRSLDPLILLNGYVGSQLSSSCLATQFSANPSPIVSSTLTGSTKLTVYASCNWDVRLGSPAGAIISTGVKNYVSSVIVGSWVGNGTRFYLQQTGDSTPAGTMASLVVGLVHP